MRAKLQSGKHLQVRMYLLETLFSIFSNKFDAVFGKIKDCHEHIKDSTLMTTVKISSLLLASQK